MSFWKIRKHDRKSFMRNGKMVSGTVVNKDNPESIDDLEAEKHYRKKVSKKAALGLMSLAQDTFSRPFRGKNKSQSTDKQIQESRYGVGAFEKQQRAEVNKADLMKLKDYNTETILNMRPNTLSRNNPGGKIYKPEANTKGAIWEKYAPEDLKEAKRRVELKTSEDITKIMGRPDLVVDVDPDSFKGYKDGDYGEGDEVVKLKGRLYGTDSNGKPEVYDFEYEQRHTYMKDGYGKQSNFPNENARENYKIYKDGALHKEQPFL